MNECIFDLQMHCAKQSQLTVTHYDGAILQHGFKLVQHQHAHLVPIHTAVAVFELV